MFSANRNYEEERVLVYLSSRAKKGKAAEKVCEIAVQFDGQNLEIKNIPFGEFLFLQI